ncbi:partner of bursicon-like [Saccoglossus kowalevskii]
MNVLIFLACCSASILMRSRAQQEDNCFPGTTDLVIHHEVVDQETGFTKYCSGMAVLKKCEGSCISQVTPSVRYGFSKECKCCRERTRTLRTVVLDACFDVDNNPLPGVTHQMVLQEPSDCACQVCAL